MSAKYEKLIDLIVNEEQDKARALFHEIVVEQSRKIYEDLVNNEEQDVNEADGESQDFVNDLGDDEDHIEGDENGIEAADGEGFEGDEFGSEEGDEFGSEEGSEGGIEDRVMDLESAIDELKAEFDQLMAGEEGEEEHAGEFGDLEGGDEFGAEGESEFDSGDEFGAEGSNEFGPDDDSEMEESMVREYVEKVGKDWPNGASEGDAVGAAGKKTSINSKSTVAGKNDMGGSAKNIARGGSETVPTGPAKPSNEYTKGQGNLIGKVENSPGSRAGQTFSQGPKAKTSQSTGVNTKSIVNK